MKDARLRRAMARVVFHAAVAVLGTAACASDDAPAEEPAPWTAPTPEPVAEPPESARAWVARVRAEEDSVMLAAPAPAATRASWDRLVITADDGTRHVFEDEVADGELRWVHRFAGSLEPLHAVLVVQEYALEGRRVLMVDRASGSVLELDDVPAPSPDGTRFVTASLDLVAGHRPNRIRIYRVDPKGPVLEREIEARGWGARSPVWLDSSTIQLERGVVDWNTHELFTSLMKLRHEAGRWTVEPSTANARDALLSFLSALGAGRYAEAVHLYGASYERLRAWSRGLDPHDLAALWQAGCEQNGLQCLGRAEVVRAESVSPTLTRFFVRLYSEDGELWTLGPCCGATPEEVPPTSEFRFVVHRAGERYLVLDLPPHTP